MKHLFFVHSHICFAISAAIIEQQAIAAGDVLLITDRNYIPPQSEWTSVVCPPEDWLRFEKNVWVGRRLIQQLEDFVATHGGGSFQYYCPHTLSPFNDFMARHRCCRAYHLIEEGTASYLTHGEVVAVFPPFHPAWKRRLWSALFHGGLQRSRSFFGPGPGLAYGSSDETFPSIASKRVLPLDFQRIFRPTAGENVQSLLCLSSEVETHICEPAHCLVGIERLIEFHRATRPQGEVLHVKRHPYQVMDSAFADHVILTLKSSLGEDSVRELQPDTAVEAIRWDSGKRIYLSLSSLAIYASRNGANCYSFAKTIAEHDVRYRRRLQQQPRAFLNAVEFL